MPSPTQVACLVVPSLPLACAVLDRPHLQHGTVAVTDESGVRVVDFSAAARSAGIRPGMALREAIALCPSLDVVAGRPAAVAGVAAALVEAMEQISPLVEAAAPGTVFADLRGTEQLFTPAAAAQIVLSSLDPGLGARIGIAGHRFTATAAAHTTEPGQCHQIGPEEAAAFVAALPVGWLPLERSDIERLQLLGLRRCGDLAALPRHAVEAQFGPAGGIAWLAARGEDPSPVRPRAASAERVVEHVQAEAPLVSREAILYALEQMLGRALRHPRARHRFVRLLRVNGETERGALWEREQVLREPLGDRGRLWLTIRTLIEYAVFPGPLISLSLELGGLTAESGRQWSLFDSDRVRRDEQLDEMVRHLKVRFGHSPVARIVAVEPWHRLPERRHALLEYDP